VNVALATQSRRGDLGPPVRSLPERAGECFLTFDDGPDPEWTPLVLDALSAAGVHATFFAIGRLAQRHASLLRRVHAAGHTVGNHAYSHRHPWTLTRAQARHEVRSGADAIAQAIGVAPGWFRPPHGRLGVFLGEVAREERQRIALWAVSAIDWGPLATAPRIRARLRAVQGGDIVLMHDGPLRHNHPDRTLRALPDVLPCLARRGPHPAPLPTTATMGA
jgi:peptidoglycan/xylan/chitin deacetylase (PgdA/CDA1 family)